jgi:hypothetical protein
MYASQRGSTFVGELVTLAIIGATLFILVTALTTGSRGVATVEKRVSAQTLARRQMETIKAVPYSPNPTSVPYPSLADTGGYSIGITVTHWLSPTGPFQAAIPAENSGLQKVRIEVLSDREPGPPVFTLEDYKGEEP